MKKKIAMLLSLVMIVSMAAGCGGGSSSSSAESQGSSQTAEAHDKVYKIKFGANNERKNSR